MTAVRIGFSPEGWRLFQCKSIELPDDVIRFSYRNQNIIKKDLFIDAVKQALEIEDGREILTGVGLPNEIIKMSIQEFPELPKARPEIERMVAWTIERSLHFPAHSTKVSYHPVGWKNGVERMLVTAGISSVIREYELVLRENHICPEVIRPVGITQFNFYAEKIPDQGVVAYLGLFENYFTFFVFIEGQLSFYQGIKKGHSSKHYLDDIDMCFEFYANQNPDQEIERLYIGGCQENREKMQDVFASFGNMDVTVLDEFSLIGKEKAVGMDKREALAYYAAAIGAAQSLLK